MSESTRQYAVSVGAYFHTMDSEEAVKAFVGMMNRVMEDEGKQLGVIIRRGDFEGDVVRVKAIGFNKVEGKWEVR